MFTKLAITFFLITSLSSAEDFVLIPIGKAKIEKQVIVIDEPNLQGNLTPGDKKIVDIFNQLIFNNFSYYKSIFSVVQKRLNQAALFESEQYSFWKRNNINYILRTSFKKDTALIIEVELLDINKKKITFKNAGVITKRNVRKIGHEIADRVYQSITGKKSIFNSKIIFVSDRTSTSTEIRKEVYIMDFDGFNKERLTFHQGIAISPAISLNRKMIIYSLIRNTRSKKRNVNLYIMNLATRKSRIISSKKGLNSGAIFLPDNKHILLTLSHRGNADIYQMNIKTKRLRKITNHYSLDVDPAISNTKLLTFLSGRSGSPNIYTADPSGMEKRVKRISFVGKFNATPRFSPNGKHIAFSSWLDNKFDIFRINSTGHNLSRLTKDFGSNEDPSYSNDGQFIAFTSLRVISNRKAVKKLYIMSKDGEIIGTVTHDFGNCATPRWTK